MSMGIPGRLGSATRQARDCPDTTLITLLITRSITLPILREHGQAGLALCGPVSLPAWLTGLGLRLVWVMSYKSAERLTACSAVRPMTVTDIAKRWAKP